MDEDHTTMNEDSKRMDENYNTMYYEFCFTHYGQYYRKKAGRNRPAAPTRLGGVIGFLRVSTVGVRQT
jgi:hypothetical protein